MAITPGRVSVSWDPSEDGVSLILSTSGVCPGSLPKVFQSMADLFECGLVIDPMKDLGRSEIACRGKNLNPEAAESQPGGQVEISPENQPISTKSQPENQPISTTGFSLAEALRTYWTIRDIAFVVGVSPQAVRKRARSWSIWRRRPTGKGREYPLSVLPGEWQTKLLAYLNYEG